MNKDDDVGDLHLAVIGDTKILIRDLLFFALLLPPSLSLSLVFGFPPTLSWLTAQKFGPLQLPPSMAYIACSKKHSTPGGPLHSRET